MAIWMQRYDGSAHIVAVAFGFNIAHLKESGWSFPRIRTTQHPDGSSDMESIGAPDGGDGA